jgi:general secretion pathway protein A
VSTTEDPGRVNGYEPFFGFSEPPFSLAPNPRFLFESASYASALGQIAYAVERREPLIVVMGEIGTGKTLLCRTVIQRLGRKTFVSVINDPQLERDDLLKLILQDFGVISRDRSRLTATTRHDLVHALQEYLASLAPLQAHAVVIIDEAQHLHPDVLEQIRLISNINDELGPLLQIILVGQPDLEAVLQRPELQQFRQRISRRVRLAPLAGEELDQYIAHRLAVAAGDRLQSPAGATGVIFTPDAMQAVSELSRGIPRVVNILCDRALEAAYAQWLRTIDAPLINLTAGTLGMPPAPVRSIEAFPSRETAIPTPSPDQPDAFAPSTFFEAEQPAPARRGNLLWWGGGLVLAATVVWFAVQPSGAPAQAPASTAPARSDTPPPAAPPATGTPSATSPPATTAPRPTLAPAEPAASPSPANATSTGERFEIVVASFRTESRAASVAAEVTALGLPMRQRVAAGWQQVLAGPFASRAQADDAQQRLDQAGMTGTQIVPTTR